MARARFREVIQDQQGNVIAGATVHVYEPGTNTPIAALMYESSSAVDLTAVANPATTDINGEVEFFLNKPQSIDLIISKTGYTTQAISDAPVGVGDLNTTVSASAPGDSAIVGIDPRPAPSDHRHAREGFGSPVTSAPGDTQSAGSAATIPRSDHRHAREAWGVGSEMFDIAVPGGGFVGGTVAKPARIDHIHEIKTFIPYTISYPTAIINVNSTVVETNLINFTVPANTVVVSTQGISGWIFGYVFNTAVADQLLTFRLKFGGITLFEFQRTVYNPTPLAPFTFKYRISRSGAAIADVWAEWNEGAESNALGPPTTIIINNASDIGMWSSNFVGLTLNWANAQVLQVTAQLNTARATFGLGARPQPIVVG